MQAVGGVPILNVDNLLQAGVWQHIAGSYDGSMMRLYLDGVEIGSMAETRALDMGSNVLIGGADMHGLIDEVAFYNRALTRNEILAIYNAGIAGKCK